MQKVLKVLSFIAKTLSVVTGLAVYQGVLPEKWLGIAVIVFGIASVLKDAVNRIGDWLDDGKANQSFN